MVCIIDFSKYISWSSPISMGETHGRKRSIVSELLFRRYGRRQFSRNCECPPHLQLVDWDFGRHPFRHRITRFGLLAEPSSHSLIHKWSQMHTSTPFKFHCQSRHFTLFCLNQNKIFLGWKKSPSYVHPHGR